MMPRRGALFALAFSLATLPGCKSHEVVPSSGHHGPVQASSVKIYDKPPKKYEEVGLIEMPVTPDMHIDEMGDATRGYDALRQRAGAMGATGVLLAIDPSKSEYLATVGDHGTFHQVPMRHNPKTAVAMAVFVIQEK